MSKVERERRSKRRLAVFHSLVVTGPHRRQNTPAGFWLYAKIAPRGRGEVGPLAASLSSHVVALPFLRFVGSVFVPDVLPFAFATKFGIS